MKGICSRHIHGYWYFVLICAGLFVYSEHFFFCDLLLLLLCAINKLFLLQFLINNNLYSILPYHSCSEFIHRSLGRRLSTFNSIRVTLVCCYYFMVERSIFSHYLQLMLIFSYFAFSSFSLPLPLSLCRSLSAALSLPLSLRRSLSLIFMHISSLICARYLRFIVSRARSFSFFSHSLLCRLKKKNPPSFVAPRSPPLAYTGIR